MALANKSQDAIPGRGAGHLSHSVMTGEGFMLRLGHQTGFFITIGMRICKFAFAIGPLKRMWKICYLALAWKPLDKEKDNGWRKAEIRALACPI